jgi:ATP-dependent RNA helicase DDX1
LNTALHTHIAEESIMSGGWASLGLMDELVAAVEQDFDWLLPTAIQDEAIPLILGGGDVMASAETGSGKTAAFALPVIQLCAEMKEQNSKVSATKKARVEPADAKWGMSALDRDKLVAIKPDSDDLVIQNRDPSKWAGCRATLGVTSKSSNNILSFECKVLDDGIVRVGWATADASLQLGTDKEGWGFGSTGVKVFQGKYDPYPSEGAPYGKDDIIGCHLKYLGDNAIISYSKNGNPLGEAFSVKIKAIGDTPLFPAVCLKNSQCSFSFAAATMSFPLPDAYQALGSLRVEDVESNPRNACVSASANAGPLAIIIEPTRDLAEQTYRVFEALCERVVAPKLTAALLVGGVNPKATIDRLRKDQVDILIGTPPITASHVKKGTIQPSNGRILVLDEADELISNEESIKDIKSIYARLLAANSEKASRFDRLQVCFFSATLESKQVQELAETLCHRPTWIKLRQNDSILPETVHHLFIEVSPTAFDSSLGIIQTDSVHRGGKLDAAISFDGLSEDEINSERIKQLKVRVLVEIIDSFDMDQVLVFCRTNLDCDLVEKYLRSLSHTEGKGMVEKYSCAVLAGQRTMQERKKSLECFKDGTVRILLATDVAARGIDIRELPFVVNMTLPDSPDVYVHRCGRVGRAERMGLSISLASAVKERVWFCQKGQKPPCSDTRDFKVGGNCIWYDEPLFLKNIESLLHKNKVRGTKAPYPLRSLPPDIQRIIESKGYGDFAADSSSDPEMTTKLMSLEHQIDDVEATETALQVNYWGLREALSHASSILREA